MDTAAYHPLPDILLSAFPSFSGGEFSDILLFRIVSVNPHRRASSDHEYNGPSKLARFTLPGKAPVLVYVRPSNVALLRARVPGAQDQRGCPSNPPYHSVLWYGRGSRSLTMTI